VNGQRIYHKTKSVPLSKSAVIVKEAVAAILCCRISASAVHTGQIRRSRLRIWVCRKERNGILYSSITDDAIAKNCQSCRSLLHGGERGEGV